MELTINLPDNLSKEQISLLMRNVELVFVEECITSEIKLKFNKNTIDSWNEVNLSEVSIDAEINEKDISYLTYTAWDTFVSYSVNTVIDNKYITINSNLGDINDIFNNDVIFHIGIDHVNLIEFKLSNYQISLQPLNISLAEKKKVKITAKQLKSLIVTNLDKIILENPILGFLLRLLTKSIHDNITQISLQKKILVDKETLLNGVSYTEQLLQKNNVSYPLNFKKLILFLKKYTNYQNANR